VEQRAVDLHLYPVQANGLADGEDMPFIESLIEGGATMARGAEVPKATRCADTEGSGTSV